MTRALICPWSISRVGRIRPESSASSCTSAVALGVASVSPIVTGLHPKVRQIVRRTSLIRTAISRSFGDLLNSTHFASRLGLSP